MPRLLIRAGLSGHQVFELKPGENIIGRGEDADLLLPNVSVSRKHCQVVVGRQHNVLEDFESQNGVTVNGQRVRQQALKSGDEIVVGKFTLIYLGDGKEDQFFRGRFVGYLPPYEPGKKAAAEEESTFALSKSAIAKLAAGSALDTGKLILVSNPKRFWYPETRGLTFGGAGMIAVEGWFTGGVVAEIAAKGSTHVIRKLGWFAPVKVNDWGVKGDQALKDGDRVEIGRTRFTYETD